MLFYLSGYWAAGLVTAWIAMLWEIGQRNVDEFQALSGGMASDLCFDRSFVASYSVTGVLWQYYPGLWESQPGSSITQLLRGAFLGNRQRSRFDRFYKAVFDSVWWKSTQ